MVSEWSHQVVRLSRQWRCPGWTLRWRSAQISPRKERIGPRREGFVHRKQCPGYKTKSFLDIICSVINSQMLFLAILPESWTNGVASRCKSSAGCSWFVRRKVLLSTRRRSPRRSGRMWRPPPSSKRRKCLPGRRSGHSYSGFFCKKKSFVGLKLMSSRLSFLSL